MFRAVLATLVGLVVMIVLVFGILGAAYVALGADRAYKPGTYDPSTAWIAATLVVGFLAAVVGGTLAARIGGHRGVRGLIVMVLALGAVNLIAQLSLKKEAPPPRTGDVSLQESMEHSCQPLWVGIANPLVGVLGVALGAARAGKRKR
jgi:hypothetical protein